MKTLKPPMTEIERDQARGMLARKDGIQNIAYWFGRSPATIHGIKKKGIPYQGLAELPPPGPYALVARQELTVIVEKAAKFDEIAAQGFVVRELERILQEYKELVARKQRATVRSLSSTLSE